MLFVRTKGMLSITPQLFLGIFTYAVSIALGDIAVIAVLIQPKQAEDIGDNDVVLLWVVVHQLFIV